jgi:predicted N-acyltransferase
MEVKIFYSITEIDENKWNEIVGRNRIICSYRFLLAVEKSNINDCKYFYPVVYDGDKIVGHACVYSMTMELDTLAKGAIKKIINCIRKFWKNFLIIKITECGSPVSLGNTISIASDTDKKEVLILIINKIENIAKIQKTNLIILRDFYEDELSFFDDVYKLGFKRTYNLPNTILEIDWNDFNLYLKNLRSHYRYKINKYIKLAKVNGLTIEIIDNFSKFAKILQNLWQNVYNHAKEYRREILTVNFFINIDKYLNDKSKVILLKKEDSIIGFALLVIDDDTMKFMFNGLDYTYNKEFAIYFNCLLSIIKLSIEMKKKEIDIGVTTYYAKTDFGAKVVNLFLYLKHTNMFLNPILTNLFIFFSPKIKNTPKNIFKEKI